MAANHQEKSHNLRNEIKQLTREIKLNERRCDYAAKQVCRYNRAIERPRRGLTEDHIQSLRDSARGWEETVEETQRALSVLDARLIELKAELKILTDYEEELLQPVPLPQSGGAEVVVSMFSGDIFRVLVDPNQVIAKFPLEFANQHGYNPLVVERLRFEVCQTSSNSDEKEESDTETYAPLLNDSSSVESWLERFESVDQFPLLHLIIQPPHEESYENTVKTVVLIRKLVADKQLKFPHSDEDLMSYFHSWYLTFQPSQKPNRYTTVRAFVKANEALFPPVQAEEVLPLQLEYASLMEEHESIHTQIVELSLRKRMLECLMRARVSDVAERAAIAEAHADEPDFEAVHAELTESFRDLILSHDGDEEKLERVIGRRAEDRDMRDHYFSYLSSFEMAELGWTGALLLRCNQPNGVIHNSRGEYCLCCQGNSNRKIMWSLQYTLLGSELEEGNNLLQRHYDKLAQQYDAVAVQFNQIAFRRDEVARELRHLGHPVEGEKSFPSWHVSDYGQSEE